MNTIQKLVKARATLVLERPFFGTLALRLKLEQAEWQPTMAVDGVHLYYHPDFVNGLSMPELKTILAHEVMHCALGHPWRRRNRDLNDWNDAADYVINSQLKSEGFTMPEGATIDDQYQGMSTEAVYDSLIKRAPDSNDDQDGASDEDDDDQSNDDQGDDDQSDANSDDSGDDGDGDSGDDDQDGASDDSGDDSSDDANDQQSGGNGEGDDQTAPDGRPAPSDSSGCGGVMDAPPGADHSQPTEADYREQEQEWKTAIAQAAQQSRVAGEMGGDLERLVTEQLTPKADWRQLLREFIQQNARDDYSWNPPNRRFVHQGIYLPSIRSENVPPLAVAIDTSGSITDEVLALFESELNAILEDVNPERVTIIYCDSRVNGSDIVEPIDLPVTLRNLGGGGTRFQPVFDFIEDEGEEPAALIYLTDMFNFDNPTDPGYPVLWADYCGLKEDEPEFGDRIIIEE